jgi:hypothetical protein
MALLGLKSADPLPSGGYSFVVTVQSTPDVAESSTSIFGPAFERCGISLHSAPLTLHATDNVSWDRPRDISVAGGRAEFCPVIFEELAVGVALRINRDTRGYLETMSPIDLRSVLKLREGQRIAVRLLPGAALTSCLTSG